MQKTLSLTISASVIYTDYQWLTTYQAARFPPFRALFGGPFVPSNHALPANLCPKLWQTRHADANELPHAPFVTDLSHYKSAETGSFAFENFS